MISVTGREKDLFLIFPTNAAYLTDPVVIMDEASTTYPMLVASEATGAALVAMMVKFETLAIGREKARYHQ